MTGGSAGSGPGGSAGSVGRLRVGVLGAFGRMGAETCRAVQAAPDLELVARIGRGDPVETLHESGVDVAVDFTRPEVVRQHVDFCVERGIPCVVGASGLSGADLEALREALAAAPAPAPGVLVAPNFSIGAVLMMRFAATAAAYFESAEIVELHHAGKADAPSGTARRTAEMVAAARAEAGAGPVPDATVQDPDGARGASVDGIHVHAVRLPGLVAHQEVLLGGHDEILTIRHDSMARSSFMPGVLLGIRKIREHPGLTVGLEHYLGL